jgi:uncharacterized protein (DUF2147 family)
MKLAIPAMIGFAAYAAASGLAVAQDASGTWLRENGSSKVKIDKCGEALCGRLVWIRDSAHSDSKGERVFYDMKPSGPGEWRGAAFNPEDGRTYHGRMVVSGDSLTTSGCVLGGLICKSIKWSRSE